MQFFENASAEQQRTDITVCFIVEIEPMQQLEPLWRREIGHIINKSRLGEVTRNERPRCILSCADNVTV